MLIHPAAEIFPRMSTEEFNALKTDIQQHGVREPIWTCKGQILDGRHRVQACQELGRVILTREYTGNDPVSFVISLNLKRRHLNASQLAFVALEIERLEGEFAKQRQITLAGTRPNAKPDDLPELIPEGRGEARDKAAETIGINPHYVTDAKLIAREAPALAELVRAGAKTITQAKRELKEQKRKERRAANAKIIQSTPAATGVYSTIVVDPPWDWGDEGDVDQLGRARPTYQTMPIEKLLALPVNQYADIDAHLYLWITNRSLPKGFALLEAWGFRYVTCLTWCKPSFGMGNYFRGQTEQVLFGVKGSLPLKRKDVGTFFHAPRGPLGHSSKPLAFYNLIESCSPGPYLEMFSRAKRDGWSTWGAEV